MPLPMPIQSPRLHKILLTNITLIRFIFSMLIPNMPFNVPSFFKRFVTIRANVVAVVFINFFWWEEVFL